MATRRIREYPVKLIAMLAVLSGICLFLTSLYFWLRFHIHIPRFDTVYQLQLVQKILEDGFWSATLEDWLAPHAVAHRIAITRLLMVVDYRYFSGQNHLIYVSAWLSIITILQVYARAFRQSYPSETTLLVLVAGLALIFLTSHTQFFNLINPINSSWYVALAASALAIWLIVSRPAPPTALHFATAYLLAIVAALSCFAGVIVWLLLPVLIALRSTRAGLIAVLLSGLFLVLYLHGISPDTAGLLKHPDFIEAVRKSGVEKPTFFEYWLKRCTSILTKTCTYLGSPLSIDHPQLANQAVIISLLAIIAGWLKLLMRRFSGRYQYNAWFELTLTMATICLGVAISTQIGRIVFSEPTADRYQTVVMVYWLSVCGLVLILGLKEGAWMPLLRFASTTLCLGVAALLLLTSSSSIVRSVKLAEAGNRISVLGMLGVSDKTVNSPLLLLALDNRDYFTEYKDFFKRNKVAYMANTIRQIDFETSTDCAHVKLTVKPSRWPGIYLVTGSIGGHWSKWYRQIPVSTDQGNVIGHLFPVHKDKLTVESLLLRRKSNWEGYFSASANSKQPIYIHYQSSSFARLSCRIKM